MGKVLNPRVNGDHVPGVPPTRSQPKKVPVTELLGLAGSAGRASYVPERDPLAVRVESDIVGGPSISPTPHAVGLSGPPHTLWVWRRAASQNLVKRVEVAFEHERNVGGSSFSAAVDKPTGHGEVRVDSDPH